MNVKRYEFELYHCNGGDMVISETGDFVSHDDYSAIEAKCAALAAENAYNIANDLYIALRTESDVDALNDKHLTICYMSASVTEKLDVNLLMPNKAYATVTSVEYWERVNLTVALIHSPESHRAHEVSIRSGFTYDFEFIPHVTIGSGNISAEHQNLMGKTLTIGSPYIRLKKSKPKTPATDAFLAEVRAQGVEMFARSLRGEAEITKACTFKPVQQFEEFAARADECAAKIRQGAAQ